MVSAHVIHEGPAQGNRGDDVIHAKPPRHSHTVESLMNTPASPVSTSDMKTTGNLRHQAKVPTKSQLSVSTELGWHG
ncbi:hypothetical protein E2C01_083648 [Portunus trituberculatus]|uniref:Uncharacterized protein n=1 Tax=Portunus trituberculatus TaxID=210409 RepID=A0A5B7J2A4_PORTR|nr:hypothetical protein [Portunus trituberculatus]